MGNETSALLDEFWRPFEKGVEIVLATVNGERAAARTVSATRVGDQVYFGTFETMAKVDQIVQNSRVALCIGALQVQGTAAVCGGVDVAANKPALEALSRAFPEDFARFSAMPGMVLIAVTPQTGGFGRMETGEIFAIDFRSGTVNKVEMGG